MKLASYALTLLRQDADFVFYRGRRGADRQRVIVVAPLLKPPRPEALRRLANEYSLKTKLDSAWAAVPLALFRENEQTTLVLEDPGGQPLDMVLTEPLGHIEFLRISIGLANALGGLHERGIIHRDVKPANAIVDTASGKVWLTGFGIASDLPHERQTPEPPETLVGTLAYMAPEQTGRMNRSIDSRSDLYSLGITLYEMLTGELPFNASDPIEWIHSHIARLPTAPAARGKEEVISAIILKLLAKTAEKRYQTAASLEADLRKCLRDWESLGNVEAFVLGAHDLSDRLLIPEKLYGRDRESKALLEAFNRVATCGTPEFVLVSGYSGIGKSSVVNELHKAIVLSHAIFVSGKADQDKRDIPYATLVQALRTLVSQILSKSDIEIESWRDTVRNALGPNGELVVNLIPEFGLIMGEQPPLADIPAQEAQNRFSEVFRRFLCAFAREEHPLVLFLDDLQWLDLATLKLLEHLVAHSDVAHLLLIGAYRDNEISPSHPLMLTLNSLREAKTIVQEIVLLPLSLGDVNQLIADTLRQDSVRTEPLARLAHEKTGSNPFFVIQFLTALREERLLEFDPRAAVWRWDLNRIRARRITENVVDLMVGKLNRLPNTALEVLKKLAGLGSAAKTADLAILHGGSDQALRSDLREAVNCGLVVHSVETYKFVHDRVQETAYSLIPEDERAAAHLRIGRLLLSNAASDQLEEKIFEIANQFNRGAGLLAAPEERARVAELNLIAGKRAQAAAAHASALSYLAAGSALLGPESWERRYELTFGLELHRAESEFVGGYLEAAEERLLMLSRRAWSTVDYAAVTCLRLDLYTTLDRSDRAVEVCLQYLSRLGIRWSPHPTEKEVLQEYEDIEHRIGSRSIESLVDLPPMTDRDCCATMDVLTKVMPPAMFTDKNLQCLVLCRMANLSLEHGNCDGSCLGYVWLGGVLGASFGDYRKGFRFGRLGVDLMERCGLSRFKSRVYLGFGSLVNPWTQHMRSGLPKMRSAFVAAQETGDLTYAAYACYDLIAQLISGGDPLVEVEREAENALKLANQARFGLMVDAITGQLRLIRTLRGLTQEFGSFDDEQFAEVQFERHLESNPHLANPACRYWIRKLQARFYAGDWAAAVEAAEKAERLLWAMPPSVELPDYYLHGALARARRYDVASAGERTRHLDALIAHQEQLAVWAESCAANFGAQAALVAGEIARIEGRALDAERLYERAIQLARENGFIQNEAIASEVAGRFYLDRGFEMIGYTYLRNARCCYLRWGAQGKVKQLEQEYLRVDEREVTGATRVALTEGLDLSVIVKALQAVSREIDLERLVESLLVSAVECAGAERGLLFLPRGQKHEIAAEAATRHGKVRVVLAQDFVTAPEFLESVLHYVIRTLNSVILDDALAENPFSHDDWVRLRSLRSVLCLPLVKLGTLIGVLYLENNLTPGVFTQSRLGVLELLASQAAISLENARLYADLRQENCDRRKAEEALAASEERMHLAAEAASLAMWEWDVVTDEIWMTDEGRALLGLPPDSRLDGMAMKARVHPDDRESREAAIRRALENKSEYASEYRIVLPGGRVRWIAGRGRLELVDGKPLRMRGVSLDITGRRCAELEAAQHRMDLAHAARLTLVGELTASITHELGQPLGAIMANADAAQILLARKQPDLHDLQQIVTDIREDDLRAGELIQRMRKLLCKRELESKPVDLNTALSGVLHFLAYETHRQRVKIEKQFGDNIPLIRGDAIHIQQVLLNLILNAVEAMSQLPESTRRLTVSTVYDGKGTVEIAVADSGPGIPTERLPRLFDSFFTTKAHGMGLGLSVVRSIVEAHGGQIWAANNTTGGACFRFTLPVHGQAD